MAGAVRARRIEFSTGRFCARKALEQIGIAPCAIPVGIRGGPVWPGGACGAITHASTVCAAVTAFTRDFAGMGIDVVEQSGVAFQLTESVVLFAGSAEVSAARAAFAGAGVAATEEELVTILFSAKESAIKAMSEKFDRYVEFTEVAILFERSTFVASCPAFGTHAEGWWALRNTYAFTAAALR
jgi:4'-phosphopantetheinyl transferase EntD